VHTRILSRDGIHITAVFRISGFPDFQRGGFGTRPFHAFLRSMVVENVNLYKPRITARVLKRVSGALLLRVSGMRVHRCSMKKIISEGHRRFGRSDGAGALSRAAVRAMSCEIVNDLTVVLRAFVNRRRKMPPCPGSGAYYRKTKPTPQVRKKSFESQEESA
jgi:hypothetical protein